MIKIDLENAEVTVENDKGVTIYPLQSQEAFKAISWAWLRCGWDTKYIYGFSWLGRPIIQLPEDMIRIQELIYAVKPDVIVETGVAHGGGQIFYADLCKAMGRGRVIGVDIEIRPHNRTAIEAHELFEYITLIEGSSVDPEIVAQVASLIEPDERVFVVLDSNHTKAHVLGELASYGPMVSVGSYIIACDGLMGPLKGAPRTKPDWDWNNPTAAAEEFAGSDERFEIDEPAFPFNEGMIADRVTYWPNALLKRVK